MNRSIQYLLIKQVRRMLYLLCCMCEKNFFFLIWMSFGSHITLKAILKRKWPLGTNDY